MDTLPFLLACFVFTSLDFASARFTIIVPVDPVVAEVGKNADLHCRLSNKAEPFEVRWFRVKSDYPYVISLYKEGNVQPECQLEEYLGRTELIKEDLSSGNVVLKIHNVSIADEGKYRCYLETDTYFDTAELGLKVTALGSDPRIYLQPLPDGAIKAVCTSSGWFPKPKLVNEDSGQILDSAKVKIQEENGLYSIEYSSVISGPSNKTFSCVIEAPLSNQKRSSPIYVTEPLFGRTSSSNSAIYGVIVFLSFCILILIAAAVYMYLKKSRSNSRGNVENGQLKMEEGIKCTEQSGESDKLLKKDKELLQDELDRLNKEKERFKNERDGLSAELVRVKAAAGPATFAPENISLDSETAHLKLQLSVDGKRLNYSDTQQPAPVESLEVQMRSGQYGDMQPTAAEHPWRFDTTPCVLGSQGFTQGRHYWEVEVQTNGGRGWAIGIARQSVRRVGWIKLCPQEGIWAMGMVMDEYQAFENPLIPLKLSAAPRRIRVYLDYAGQLAFYNANTMDHIFTFMVHCNEQVHPFFWIMDSQTAISLSTAGTEPHM